MRPRRTPRPRPVPRLGPGEDASTPSYLLSLGRELSPTSLRLSVKLKGHSTLRPPYPEPRLIIMMPIIIPLNTNKQLMFILIRCDGMSSRIILFYYYKITSLSLLRCIKQVKSGNIKGSMNRQEKKGEKNLIL
jgi:hypothetical protein